MKNFPFRYNSQILWYSRGIVCSTYVYAQYNNEWYVLCAQRGKNQTWAMRWNVPGGYLDFDETVEQCAKREVFEETGVRLKDVTLVKIDSVPKTDHQSVILSFISNLGVVKELPEVSQAFNEPGETNEVCWCNVKEVYQKDWILDHEDNIAKFFRDNRS